jgi:hypothetical protein
MSNPSRKSYYAESSRLTRNAWRNPQWLQRLNQRHRYFVREHIEAGAATFTVGGQAYPVVPRNITLTREVPPPVPFFVPGSQPLSGSLTFFLRS